MDTVEQKRRSGGSPATRVGRAEAALLRAKSGETDLVAQGESESESRYRELVEVASDWVWETDAEDRFSYYSSNFRARVGVSPDLLLGRTRAELVATSLAPEQWREHLATLAARRPFKDFVYRALAVTGESHWVRISGFPRFAADGAYLGYRGTGRIVTAEVEAALALKESERRLRAVVETGSDWLWETDAELRFSYLSPNFAALTGVDIAALLGRREDEIAAHWIDPAELPQHLALVRRRQPFRDATLSIVLPGGKRRWHRFSGAPLIDESGVFCGYVGAGSDVSAAVEVQQLLRRFHDSVAHIGQPLSIFDSENRLVACNQSYKDLHKEADGSIAVREGMTVREVTEWRLRSSFWRRPPVGPEGEIGHVVRERWSVGTYTYELADGRTMLVDAQALPDGGSVSLWTDVTSVRELETQVQHAQRLDALGCLAGGIAHDLNNALVPVLAMTKAVARKLPAGAREQANLDLAVKGAERARDLVQKILLFSRKEEAVKRLVNMGDVVAEALHMLRAGIPSTIRFEATQQATPPVLADPGQLHQVLLNLVTNAAQAIGERNGVIAVSLAAESGGREVRLSIADTGDGIDEETRGRIFEPFFTTKKVGEGTGLGLAVVHGIVTGHGGRISVSSTVGAGTRFDVVLPAAAEKRAAGA